MHPIDSLRQQFLRTHSAEAGRGEAIPSHRIPDYQPRKFHRGKCGPILISWLIITFG
jgi:hypothetical protein